MILKINMSSGNQGIRDTHGLLLNLSVEKIDEMVGPYNVP